MANQTKIAISEEALEKIANFISVAVQRINDLTTQLNSAESLVKSADTKAQTNYQTAVTKVAQLIRNSDLEYMIDGFDAASFVKKANANPDFFVATLNSVLNIADPVGYGKTTNIKTASSTNQDPVYQRAFGIGVTSSSLMFE